MELKHLSEHLFFRTWWAYHGKDPTWFDASLHTFNLFEGAVWFILAVLVLLRYFRFRRSSIEVVYTLAFFTFGLTDLREAYSLQSWLIWLKAANLLILLGLRAHVMRRHYPASRLY